MSTPQPAWIDPFDLAARQGTPDLVLAGQDVSSEAHADALRVAFRLGIEGFFTISSVPTAAFLTQPELNRAAINDLHDKLWNQGLASLLIVLAREQIRVYSLWAPPIRQGHDVSDQDDRRLVDLLNLTTDALQVRQLISSVESGRYFRMNPRKFDPGTRVDASLVANLRAAHQLLTATALPSEASRSLILQTVFISYLEDRHVIDEAFYRESLVEKEIVELRDLLRQGGPEALLRLFSSLRESFNGDLFYAPAAFQADAPQVELTSQHLSTLFEFRQGLVENGNRPGEVLAL